MTSNTGYRDYNANLPLPLATNALPVLPVQSWGGTVILAEEMTPDLETHRKNAENEQIIPISPKVSFYRTRKGIIAIVVLVVVIAVAAIVGGVVAALKKKQVSSHHDQGSITPGKTQTVMVTVHVHGTPTRTRTTSMTPIITPIITPSIYVPGPGPLPIPDTGGLITAGI
jgi:hypothetical protein